MGLDNINKAFRYHVVLGLGLLSSCAIAPLALIRFMRGDYVVAALDTLIVIGVIACIVLMRRGADPNAMGRLGAVVVTFGAAAVAFLDPERGLMWVYAVIIANFLLVPHRVALGLSIVLVLSVAIRPSAFTSLLDYGGFIGTALSVSAFAAIFAWRTEWQGQQLEQLAMQDALTQVGNRRALMQRLDTIIGNYRPSTNHALMLMDLDDFKGVNDTWGHEVGDQLLCDFAQLIRQYSRRGDELFRLGGEEFVLLMPRTDLAGARTHAEHVRQLVQQHLRASDRVVTTSIGVSHILNGETASQWLSRTDRLMYMAKHHGRNQVVCEGDAIAQAAQSNT